MASCQNPRRRAPVTPSDVSLASALGLKTNMTLRKGATFHSHSPTSSPDEFIPPTLGRSQSNLDDVVDAHRRRMALIVNTFDTTLNLDASPADAPASLRDESHPVPRGLLAPPVVDPVKAAADSKMAERRVARPRHRRSSRHHESDSGLGTSLGSTTEKHSAACPSKETKASAITRSAAATSTTMVNQPGLGRKAIGRVTEHVLRPLLAKPSLKDFEPIVLDVPRRIRDKEIICLRDLEKTLIFMAPERTKTAGLYLDFCLTSIRCIQATVEFLSEREQTRPSDRPYTNGYFIDLEEQIRQYAKQLALAKEAGPEADSMDVDPYAFTLPPLTSLLTTTANLPTSADQVKLHGGIAFNGHPAELVRIRKDGKAISMATGLPVDLDEDDSKGPVKLKRSLSQQLEDEEEIMRSMARRKKNASPEELAPKKCREPGCNKEFKRPCDLTKHEKTHSRPWKCPVPTCKYHEFGWPTEKEMDRHHNDKHSSAPAMYECQYKPCPYKSKRESNCKQHMEKAHGWTYVRTKTNGKKPSSKAGSSTQPTPQLGTMPTPSSNHSIATPPEDHIDQFMPFNDNTIDFPHYISHEEFNNQYLTIPDQQPPFSVEEISLDMSPDHSTPSTDASFPPYSTYQEGPEFTINDDIYNASAHVPVHVWPSDGKLMAGFPNFPPVSMCEAQPAQPQTAPHISPIGQGNAMLFTPNSLAEVDEGFDDCPPAGDDFQLYPSTDMSKAQFQPLFGEIPSSGLGFSQGASQALFAADMDWATNLDYQPFYQQPHQQQQQQHHHQ